MRFFLVTFFAVTALAISSASAEETVDLEAVVAYEPEDDAPKTELGKALREELDKVLEKIKDAIDNGKTVREEYLEKARKIREELKKMGEGISVKAKEFMTKIREKGKDYIKKILENLGLA